MINFNDLTCVVSDSYSFVGIIKVDNQLHFHLPKGFEANSLTFNTFECKRDLFFLLYRVLYQFKSICIEKGYLEPLSEQVPLVRDRDGIVRGDTGSTITTNLDEPLIFYSKLDSLGALLDAYDELKITALCYRLGHTNRIDLSQIYRYLDRGIFLPNGAVYVDEMLQSRQHIQFNATDIVALYCYLVREVKVQLKGELSPEVSALAEQFQQHYMSTEDSLFTERGFERVIVILKEALETIDRKTPLKDADYDQFYDAVERFLYGRWQDTESGEIWGISNFYMVWESICLNHLAKIVPAENLLFLDHKFVSAANLRALETKRKSFDLSRAFELDKSHLVPDAVVFPPIDFIALSLKQDFSLVMKDWNNYGYLTQFHCYDRDGIFSKKVNITYQDQPTQSHTIDKLRKYCDSRHPSVLKVNRPLPKKFISYWKIKNEVTPYEWAAMRQLNHIFYIAVNLGYWTFEQFQDRVLAKAGVTAPGGYGGTENAIERSLFRDRTMNSIREELEAFITHILQFQIVDIKYHEVTYFYRDDNREEIKSRSVRKQFVYEYLLQQLIKKTITSDVKVKINSSFWIPQISADSTVFCDGPSYLNGYLKLALVNLHTLMDSYCHELIS
jgi:hypothetical protein